jgi:hypothetical protein
MALQPLSQESYRCSGRDIIGSVFVKFYRDYETKNSENSTFVGAPERLYKAIVDFAEANEINLNSRQFPKAHNILVKKLKAIKPNLKAGFGIIVDIERDSSNNSIITIYRNKTKPNPTIWNYYGIRVQQKHLQNTILLLFYYY